MFETLPPINFPDKMYLRGVWVLWIVIGTVPVRGLKDCTAQTAARHLCLQGLKFIFAFCNFLDLYAIGPSFFIIIIILQ